MSIRTLFLALSAALATSASAVTFSGIRAFGDSLTDRGNTVAELGIILNETDVYNSNFYDDGRWSNGPVWIEHVNTALGFTSWSRNNGNAWSLGQNFAWGGSRSGTGYKEDLLPNLLQQIEFYLENPFVGPQFDYEVGTKLFSVWSGGNDVIDAVQGGEPIDVDALSTQMAENIATAITTLYQHGGRYFIVPNLPDLGKKPNYRTNPFYAGEATAIVEAYNPKLAAKIASLRSSLPGITIYAFDAYTLLNDAITNPGKYNFINVTENSYVSDPLLPLGGYVRDDVDLYLFWDTTHPTRVGHAILAQAVLQLLAGDRQEVAMDVTPPSLLVSAPPAVTTRSRIRLRGLAMDDRKVRRVEASIDGKKFRRIGRGNQWSTRIRLKDGRNVIRIRAIDDSGNTSPVQRVVIVKR